MPIRLRSRAPCSLPCGDAARRLRHAAVLLGRPSGLGAAAGVAARGPLAGKHSGAGSGRALGIGRLSQGRGPRTHRNCGARPMPPALQYRPRPARRHDHASCRPGATDRAQPQGRSRTARTTSGLAEEPAPAASATAKSSRSTAACWSRASSIPKSLAATAPASMCVAAPRRSRARRAQRSSGTWVHLRPNRDGPQ